MPKESPLGKSLNDINENAPHFEYDEAFQKIIDRIIEAGLIGEPEEVEGEGSGNGHGSDDPGIERHFILDAGGGEYVTEDDGVEPDDGSSKGHEECTNDP